jgi:hypothetical protein
MNLTSIKMSACRRRVVKRRSCSSGAKYWPRVFLSFAEIVRGSLVTRYRRCGKPTCHCVKGEGHGPAHYLVVTLKPG